ncbi:hypothetical protein F5Y19DRAFT_106916 [Xylariaceae sp. FL1651]|nr:hypothetical protein F5Y19DRAFT_106916 [Xylariaceae sp. FL1651]
MRHDCEAAMMFLVSYSQLVCGEQGIPQADKIHHLTKLTSSFVPLSFVASGFSMNVKELQENFLSLWVFVVTAILIAGATYVVVFWPSVSAWSSRKLNRKGGKLGFRSKPSPSMGQFST